jgi:hypothetical protein
MRYLKMIRVEWLLAAFCAWHSAGPLLQAWQHSPFERFGWVALIIWLIPAARMVCRGADTSRDFKLAIISLVLSFIGVIGDLNVLVYCGLAGVIGAMANVSGRGWLWLVLAVCWIPAFSLFFARFQFTPHMVQLTRLVVALLAAGLGLCWLTPPARKTPA